MNYSGNEIAIIGINLKFPGSNTVEEFWDNLCNAKESIRDVNDFELELEGISADKFNKKNYIKKVSVCDDYDKFDAAFFGYSTHEARTMDPQHRLFLQSCWSALEQAGYAPSKINGQVGVFGSAGYNTYLINSLLSDPNYLDEKGYYDVLVGNDKDYLATRVSYKMGLTGPSVTVQTACSSSLVSVHLACQSLLLGESDMCLAGGVCVSVPCKKGYEYQPGFIVSNDGHCRAFDKDSSGTVFGSGVGVVVLKRLADAIANNDMIYSIIKSTAVNNDGNRKIGFTAPSQEGQEDVLKQAMNLENITPKSIAFIEAHGTGTTLGDPIELNAIMNIWGLDNEKDNMKYPCAISSVKSNIGHMDAAAGIAGLIKASLCINHRTIVPTVHFKELNKNVSFKNTRFYISNKVKKISRKDEPIRSVVSAFGVGGTNVSIILEEPPIQEYMKKETSREYIIKVSAKSKDALDRMVNDINNYLPSKDIGALAYTLNTGREDFEYRTFLFATKDQNQICYVNNPEESTKNGNLRKSIVLSNVELDDIKEWQKLYKQIGFFRSYIDRWFKIIHMELGIQCDNVNHINETIENNLQLQKLLPFIIQVSWIMSINKITNNSNNISGYGLGKITEKYISGNITETDAIKAILRYEITDSKSFNSSIVSNGMIYNKLNLKGFLCTIGELWKSGVNIEWEKLFEDDDKRHISAPTYSFEKIRYWYKDENINKSFVWKEGPVERKNENNTLYKGKTLILGDNSSKFNSISELLIKTGGSKAILNKDIISQSIQSNKELKEKIDQLVNKEALYEIADLRIVCLLGIFDNYKDYEYFYKILYICKYLNKTLTKCNNIHLVLVHSLYGNNKYTYSNMLMSGIALTLPLEYPNITVKQIEIQDELTKGFEELWVKEIFINDNEKRVILQNKKRYAVEYKNALNIVKKNVLKENGTYIITGGTGNVGLLFAREISKRVKANIYLLSKHYTEDSLIEEVNPKIEAIIDVIKSIKESGSSIFVKKTDVSNYDELSEAIEKIEKQHGSIDGIIHAAGKVGKACNFIENVVYDDVVEFCNAKVEGAYNLKSILNDKTLDFCILVSSTVSVLGGLGDCVYSGTNAVLNHIALLNSEDNIPYVAVAFDYLPRVFEDKYVSEDDERVRSLLANQLTIDEFSNAFDQILSSISDKFIIISKSNFNNRLNVINDIKIEDNKEYDHKQNNSTKEEIKQKVNMIWKRVLENECDDNLNFFDAGGDSFLAIKLTSMLNYTFDMKFSVKYLYEYSTISLIAENIYINLCEENVAKEREARGTFEGEKDDELVVIGMAGRFPGADNIDELWENILNKQCNISHFSSDCNENLLNAKPDGSLNKYVGARGVINDVDKFDYQFFNISKVEAELMDPQQRVFLECAWEALEDGGCTKLLDQYKIGVFASQGISTYMVNNLLKNGKIQEDYNNIAVINNSPDSLATRVSYVMNLTGVSKSVQTFCSSSLVALEEAITNIKNGRCDIAIAGGVNIVVPQHTGYIYNERSIYSADGNVRPFDNSANGTVFSNGAGVIVLARKEWAEQNGKQIYANVLSVGINNDGSQKASFLSPSVKGQAECIKEAYERARVMPKNVAYIETHGTATKVGDPIEVHALTKAFEEFTDEKGYCAIGSIKGNIGHLDRAAGITGFIKACMIVKNRCIPPIAYFEKANKNINFDETPFYVNKDAVKYNEDDEMIVGVSALGVGGTNVHVVLSSEKDQDRLVYNRQSHIFNFSAKCEESLINYLYEFSDYISSHNLPMQEAETTLQMHRKMFDVRCSVVANTEVELKQKLKEKVNYLESGVVASKINTILFKLSSEVNKLIDIITSICEVEKYMKEILLQQVKNYYNEEYMDFNDVSKNLLHMKDDAFIIIKKTIKQYFSDLLMEKVIILFMNDEDTNPMASFGERTVFVNLKYRENETKCSEEININENDISGLYHIISNLWNSGLTIDWSKYNRGFNNKMIHLPGYSFKKIKCWIDEKKYKENL